MTAPDPNARALVSFDHDADADPETTGRIIFGVLSNLLNLGDPIGWYATVDARLPSGDVIRLRGFVTLASSDDLRLLPSDGEESTGFPALVPMNRVESITFS